MNQFIKVIKEFFECIVVVFFVMIFSAFMIALGTVPLILAFVYSGWYSLLYFITIPTFFAIYTL